MKTAPVKPASKAKAKAASDLPLPVVAEELAFLRKLFRDLLAAYGVQVEGEIARLEALIKTDAESRRKLPATRVADLRDMLMQLRSLEVKPAKGRRRDLKKVETLVADLAAITDRWE